MAPTHEENNSNLLNQEQASERKMTLTQDTAGASQEQEDEFFNQLNENAANRLRANTMNRKLFIRPDRKASSKCDLFYDLDLLRETMEVKGNLNHLLKDKKEEE